MMTMVARAENNLFEYKGYQVKPHREYPAHYIVVTTGRGGKIPDILSGMFTARHIAFDLIDKYVASRGKDSGNGETS